MILGGAPIPVGIQSLSLADIVSRQGTHICHSSTDVQQKRTEIPMFNCKSMGVLSYHVVHGEARWVTERQKLHRENSTLQTGKWGKDSLSPSGLVSANLSCEGSVSLIGKR